MRGAGLMLAAVVVLVAAPAWADFEAGKKAYFRGDYATALKEIRPLAEQGDASAQFNLGQMYRSGRGVPQDYNEAVRWYRRAAEQGQAEAQFGLGVLYRTGEGVPQDYVEAMGWFRQAAASGHSDAQVSL